MHTQSVHELIVLFFFFASLFVQKGGHRWISVLGVRSNVHPQKVEPPRLHSLNVVPHQLLTATGSETRVEILLQYPYPVRPSRLAHSSTADFTARCCLWQPAIALSADGVLWSKSLGQQAGVGSMNVLGDESCENGGFGGVC